MYLTTLNRRPPGTGGPRRVSTPFYSFRIRFAEDSSFPKERIGNAFLPFNQFIHAKCQGARVLAPRTLRLERPSMGHATCSHVRTVHYLSSTATCLIVTNKYSLTCPIYYPLFRVRWYGYEDDDSTWEPAHHIDYNTVVRYCRKTDTNSGTLALGTPRQRGTQELHALDPDPGAPYTRHENDYRMLMETRVTSLGTPAGRLGPTRPSICFFIFLILIFLEGVLPPLIFGRRSPNLSFRHDVLVSPS